MLSEQAFKRKALLNQQFISVFALLIIVAFIAGIFLTDRERFAMQLNAYSLISFAALLVSITILIAVIRNGVRSEPRGWFILYLFSSVMAAIYDCLTHLTPGYSGQYFWFRLLGTCIAVTPMLIYLFTVAYTTGTAIRHNFVAPIMMAASVLVACLYTTNLIVYSTHEQFPWGYGYVSGPLYFIDIVWIIIPYVAAITLMLRYRSSTNNELIRKQSTIYAIAFAVPFIGGILTDGLAPAINFQIPSIVVALNSTAGLLIFYGIKKYHLAETDSSVFSDSILGTMNEAVLVLSNERKLEFSNEEALKLFGSTINEPDNLRLESLFSEETWRLINAHIESNAPLPKEVGQLKAIGQDKQEVPIQVVISRINPTALQSAYIIVISDVTSLTRSYNELQISANRIAELLKQSQLLQKQLADEKANVEHVVEVRTKELREAQEKLKAEDKLKQEFIALSSHNLRTPLSILKWSMELLKTQSVAEEREKIISSMESGIGNLDSFIKDISIINDLEAGVVLDTKVVDLKNVFGPLIEDTGNYAQAKQISFETNITDQQTVVHGNSQWLQHCIRNLLNNAIKFTEHGSIKLSCYRSDSNAVIEVQDTGIGIKAEEIPLLFTKFHRGTSYETYNYEGEGLALYLTKLIVERHNGTITVDSQEGQGSTFRISLPLAEDSEVSQ